MDGRMAQSLHSNETKKLWAALRFWCQEYHFWERARSIHMNVNRKKYNKDWVFCRVLTHPRKLSTTAASNIKTTKAVNLGFDDDGAEPSTLEKMEPLSQRSKT